MSWNLDFITESNFKKHVADTILKYGEKLEPYDIEKFNKNIIDPVKLIFDKTVYHSTWEQIISNEIFRQRDKSNNNDIGYFHQRIFQYINKCRVPENGRDGGWDVIFDDKHNIRLPDDDRVSTIYVEMKKKHNTMNSASARKTYIKMQNKLLENDDCACFLVEAIAQKSQNIKWETTVDGKKVSHRRIRRVSIDKFYEIVTGEKTAFYQMCMVLPGVIQEVVESSEKEVVPHDTVFLELCNVANQINVGTEDLSMALAIYLLGFSSYQGFNGYFIDEINTTHQIKEIEAIYQVAKRNNNL